MTNSKKHGGKRKGAGRKPKWDPLFKLRVGQDCENLFRQEEELAKKRQLTNTLAQKLISRMYGTKCIRSQFLEEAIGLKVKLATNISPILRKNWKRSELRLQTFHLQAGC